MWRLKQEYISCIHLITHAWKEFQYGYDNLQCVLFYVDKSICSFDPLKIASDLSNISKIHCLVWAFYKNTLNFDNYEKYFLGIFHHFTKSGIFHNLSKNALSKNDLLNVHMLSMKIMPFFFR